MLELPACDLESFWSEAAGPGGDWGACGGDVVGYVVFYGLLCAAGLGYGGKFSEKGLEGVLWLPGEESRAERRHL